MSLIIGGLDTETTGLKQSEGHRIIEVCLKLHREDGSRIGGYTTRINPMRGIDPAAEAVHGISLDMLIGEPTWEQVAPKLATVMGKCDVIVAHNGVGFDGPFLYEEFKRVDIVPPQVRLVDTMLQGRWATPDGALPNLRRLCWACGVDYDKDKAHAADYDVDVMLQCFFSQWQHGFFQVPDSIFTP
jgi:DNA polymerase III subunit epsilon